MKPGSKPRKITSRLLEQIELHACRGLSQQLICHALGIPETRWYEAKQKNRIFRIVLNEVQREVSER